MENYQVNDSLFLSNKEIIGVSNRPLKMPKAYISKLKEYWSQQLNKKYADIDIRDDDDSSSVLILDSNKIFKNKVIDINYETLNIIKIPFKQADIIKKFYLSQLPAESNPQDFILDNSLELYRLREENNQLKQEIARLKYLYEKNNNV